MVEYLVAPQCALVDQGGGVEFIRRFAGYWLGECSPVLKQYILRVLSLHYKPLVVLIENGLRPNIVEVDVLNVRVVDALQEHLEHLVQPIQFYFLFGSPLRFDETS